jgi:hypothetical protein
MSGQDSTIFAVSGMPGMDSITELSMQGMELLEKLQIHQPTWYFVYLFTLISFFAWIRLYYGNNLTQTVQASINFQVANRMFNDNSMLQTQLDMLLYLFYFLSNAFFLYFIEMRLGLHPHALNGGWLYLFNLALLAGVFFSRVVLLNAAGIFFNQQRLVKEYLYNLFIFNQLSGMVVLPLLFLLVYTTGWLHEVVFWLSLAASFSIVVMRLIRGLVFSSRKDVLLFYMFLYLCALEIAPLVLLYRWLEGIL